ncbi:MAG: DUF3127 domain-containing protein [Bacteroidales bacterium]|nr:DUF3127 domain-containing protein [Bacteroidales bacterium]
MQTITGTFIKALPVTEGDSQRGHWYRGGFIIKFGEELIKPDTLISVNYQPESREFNGRWYTELRCFSISQIAPHN